MAHLNYFEIRWKNFRGFRDTGWLKIKPLTILIGPNNAGKSSIISPLLLLGQTLQSSDALTSLISRGSLVDGGTFRDLVHEHDINNEIFMGIKFHTHDPKGGEKEIGSYPPGAVELTFSQGDRAPSIDLVRFSVYDIFMRKFFSRTRMKSGRFSLRGKLFEGLNRKERRAINSAKPRNFLFTPTSTIYSLVGSREKFVPSADFTRDFELYLNILSTVFFEIRSVLGGVNYIGPIRQKAQRYYPASGEIPSSVGPRGENAPGILLRQESSEEVSEEISAWMKKFEFGESVEIKDSGETFSVMFCDGPKKRNIADAGFGASQTLPLIVQAAAAEKGSLTIAEQPEIHLNPKLQCVLGDLFAEMVRKDSIDCR